MYIKRNFEIYIAGGVGQFWLGLVWMVQYKYTNTITYRNVYSCTYIPNSTGRRKMFLICFWLELPTGKQLDLSKTLRLD